MWSFYILNDRLYYFANGPGNRHLSDLYRSTQVIAYKPEEQKFVLIKDRRTFGYSSQLALVECCRKFLDCTITVDGNWTNIEDAVFFHLKWAGQPNQSY
jgi:hypothetical protein